MDRSGQTARWGWFAAWMIVGAGYSFGFLSFAGLFVLPIALLVTVVLLRARSPIVGIHGLVSGLGLPILYIALINRQGPGEICRTTATENYCVSQLSPWPWVITGSILVVIGLCLSVIKRREVSERVADTSV
jgi:glucan phosphoethanolaminetransferase (alkaline phosphatase superfamily)